MYPVLKPAAAALMLAAASTAFSQTAGGEGPVVVVTASRFAEAEPALPANVSIITREEIERSPAQTIPDLLKSYAGVDVRPLYGSMGIDATVDIRGIGDAAGSNVLVLLDGQRLNPVNMAAVKWETVPLTAVRQIEIMRGSASALYGDRASAGVINIITDKSDKPRAGGRIEAGSFGYGSLDAHVAGGKDGWYGNLFANASRTDGYRENSDAQRDSVSGRGARRFDHGELFIDVAGYYEDYGLPSSLTRAQFDRDPKLATTPHYRLTRDGYRLRPGGSLEIGPQLRLEVDGSFASDDRESRNPDWAYRNRAYGTTQAFSPRLKWSHGAAGALSSDTVLGFDYFDGEVISDSLNYTSRARLNRQRGNLANAGIYGQNQTVWQNSFDSTVAVRRQHFEEKVADEGAALNDKANDSLTAWELGGGYRFSAGRRIYAKLARDFRLPNTDELFAYNCAAFPCTTVFNGALKPQTGHQREVGAVWQGGAWTERLALFRQDNDNEIGYIAANGRNANLDPLRRQGAESETVWRPGQAWMMRLALTYVDAKFTEGRYDGKTVPLVPRHKESLTVQWDGGRHGVHAVVVQNVGDRYFGSDFTNTRSKLAGYNTVDYQATWNLKPWTLGLRVTNLTDTKYAPVGYSGSYYPADARSLFVSAKLDY